MNKVAIIGSGVIAKVIAERARELNIETHCFSWDSHDTASASVDFFHEINIFETEKITEVCKTAGVNGIIATTEITILPAAEIANNLGLNGNPIDVAHDITNKYITRNKVKSVRNLNQPKFWIYKRGEYPQIDCLPVIVKPLAAGGKRGIQVVYDINELPEAINKALPFSKVEGVLIEEYLDGGIEYSVESLSYNGTNYVIQVTQKDTSGPPHCNELGHHQPAQLSSEMRERVNTVISDMLTATGIKNGPCHTEIKIINEEIYLIEINGRPGGDHISYPLTELSTGYSFISAILWISMNCFEEHVPQNLESNYSGIYFVTEETAYLQPIFEKCEEYDWLYFKNHVSDEPSMIVFNDEDNLNYFIYYSKIERPDIDKLLR